MLAGGRYNGGYGECVFSRPPGMLVFKGGVNSYGSLPDGRYILDIDDIPIPEDAATLNNYRVPGGRSTDAGEARRRSRITGTTRFSGRAFDTSDVTRDKLIARNEAISARIQQNRAKVADDRAKAAEGRYFPPGSKTGYTIDEWRDKYREAQNILRKKNFGRIPVTDAARIKRIYDQGVAFFRTPEQVEIRRRNEDVRFRGQDTFAQAETFRRNTGRKFHNGGMVGGYNRGGGVPIMAQTGEFVMRRQAVQNIGASNLQNMNRNGNINLNSSAASQELTDALTKGGQDISDMWNQMFNAFASSLESAVSSLGTVPEQITTRVEPISIEGANGFAQSVADQLMPKLQTYIQSLLPQQGSQPIQAGKDLSS